MAFPREELIPYLKVVFPITSIILDFSLTLVAYLAPYNSPFPVNSLVKVLLSPQSGDSPILYFGAFGMKSGYSQFKISLEHHRII